MGAGPSPDPGNPSTRRARPNGMTTPLRAAFLLLLAFPVSAQSPWSSQEPYTFPFDHYDEWLAFMDESPDPAWQAEAMQAVIPREDWERYASGRTVTAKRIRYLSDGLEIRGYAFAPRESDGPLPVVLFGHGGTAEWGRITFVDILEMYRLAERGYIVLASALRGEGGSEGTPNLGSGDRQDILDLLALAKTLDGADPSRLGYWGFSRGAGLGYRVLAATDEIRAAVLIGGGSDAVNSARRAEFEEFVYPGVLEGWEDDPVEALRRISPMYWPEEISASTDILLLHGANDDRVPVSGSLTMAGHLARLGRTFRLVVAEGGSHALIEHLPEVRREMDRWFDERLKR